MLCSDVGVELQYEDSRISERILEFFTQKGIVVLPVHDSYIVPESHALMLQLVMYDAWASETRPRVDWSLGGLEMFKFIYTDIKQTGYVDELLPQDPEGHNRMMRLKEAEYVSPRYKQVLEEFRRWREWQLLKAVSNEEDYWYCCSVYFIYEYYL